MYTTLIAFIASQEDSIVLYPSISILAYMYFPPRWMEASTTCNLEAHIYILASHLAGYGCKSQDHRGPHLTAVLMISGGVFIGSIYHGDLG